MAIFQQLGCPEVFKIAQTYCSPVSYHFSTMNKPDSPLTVEEVIENWQRQAEGQKLNRGRRAKDRVRQAESSDPPPARLSSDVSNYDS